MKCKILPCGRKKEEREGLTGEDLQSYRSKLVNFIHEKKLKFTEQRWQVAEVLLSRGGHADAQEIVAMVEKKHPQIGAATVYRSLKVLCEAGVLIESHRNEAGLQYYEAASLHHHDHIVCMDCHEIFEFNNDKIEKLQEEQCAQMGFTPTGHTHMIYARCSLLK